jgi:carbamate kinase
VALGGNAITRPGEEGTVEQDYANLDRSLGGVVALLEQGYELVLTHGNGPQIGNQMIRVEVARDEAPILPLDLMGADIQGGMGYMIEKVLRSKLRKKGMTHRVCCLITLVEVDASDPAFDNPTKFVGPFYEEKEVEELCGERGWVLKEDSGRGWRRVVPSPKPIAIIEQHEITALLDSGAVVICGGGGGIPVARSRSGDLEGMEGVIDKDLASAIIALGVRSPELVVLTGAERVLLNFGTPEETPISIMSVLEARKYQEEGHFPAGSMGPKIDAACRFIEGGGSRTLITEPFKLREALEGQTGTWITP